MHGGYFEGRLCQRLIYRLACLGVQDTVASFNGLDQLSRECEGKQIRMLLSPTVRPLVDQVARPVLPGNHIHA
jgi:hypothetical protein